MYFCDSMYYPSASVQCVDVNSNCGTCVTATNNSNSQAANSFIPMPKYIFVFMLCILAVSCERETFACRPNTTNFPSQDNGVCHIENPAVKFFMSASDANFSVKASCITQAFFDDILSYRPDQPVGKTISFFDTKAKEVKVRLTEKDDASSEVFQPPYRLPMEKASARLPT